jgi:integrase
MKNELEYQKFKGLIVFCNKCKRNIHNKQKGKKCNHPIDKQVYKAVVRTGIGYERKTKVLEARDFGKAVTEFRDFKHQVKNPHLYQPTSEHTESPYLEDAMAMYIDYLYDEGVPHHMKKHLTKSYVKTTECFLTEFVDFLIMKGVNLTKYKLSSINDDVVGSYCAYIEKKSGSNYTYNGKIKAMRIFYNYLIEQKDYLLKNVWKKVKTKSEKPTDISISDKDFYDLLSSIKNSEESKTQIGNTKRNMYRPWLKDLIRLKAFTGRRNAELFAMKWNMVYYEHDMPVYIKSPDIKINKQQNNFDEKDFQFAYVPVGEELLELLIDLKLEENYDSDEYIIAPEVENRDNLEKQTSKYFSFFFKKLKRNYTKQLKHLRQTYITREDLFVNTKISMQHSNYRTTSKHYIDKREVAKQMALNGFRIFPKQTKNDTPERHSRHKKRATSL